VASLSLQLSFFDFTIQAKPEAQAYLIGKSKNMFSIPLTAGWVKPASVLIR
jgi:hypothetical protein